VAALAHVVAEVGIPGCVGIGKAKHRHDAAEGAAEEEAERIPSRGGGADCLAQVVEVVGDGGTALSGAYRWALLKSTLSS
jgi:hypothetical protein